MTIFVAFGVCVVILVEVLAWALDRTMLLPVTGAVAGVLLLSVRARMSAPGPRLAGPEDAQAPETLRRWLVRTETLISRADSTQRDWDRHLRPMLARQFELATGQRQRKDPVAFRATGEMLFGPRLWALVDPDRIERGSAGQPGPGRAALDDILRRLEQI